MTSLVVDSAAWCSWLVRTSLRGGCQVAINRRMAVVYASYSLRIEGEAIRESIVRKSTEMCSRWMCWGWGMAMANEFYNKQCHVWCFYSPFHISSAFLIVYLQVPSFALPSRACSTCLLVNRLAHSKFSFNQSSVLLIKVLDRFCQEDSMRLINSVR